LDLDLDLRIVDLDLHLDLAVAGLVTSLDIVLQLGELATATDRRGPRANDIT